MLESSCNTVVGVIDKDVVVGDSAFLRTKRVFYDTIRVTKIDYSDGGGIWFEYTCPECSRGRSQRSRGRMTKKEVVGWPAVTELRKYR